MKPGFKFSSVGVVLAICYCASSVHSSFYGHGRTFNALVGVLCAFSNIGDSSALPHNHHLPPHLFQSRLGSPMPDIGGSSGPPPPPQAQSDEEDSDSEEDEELLESGPRVEPHITPLNRDQCLAKLLCGMSVPVTGGGSKKNYYSEYANIVSKFFEAFPLDDELQSKESIETYDDYSNEDEDKPKRTNSRRKPLNSSRVEATTPKLHLFDLALVDVAKPEELNGQPQNRTKKEFIQKVISAYRGKYRVSRARKLVENLGQKLQTVRQCQSIDGCPFTFKQLREQLKKKEAQRISSNVPLPPLGLQPQGPNPNRPQQQPEPIAFKPKPYVSAESRPRPIPPTPMPESAELFSKEDEPPIFPPHKDVNKGDDEMEEIFGPPKVNKKPNMGFHHGIDENFNYEYNPERPWRPGSSGSNSYAHRPWNVNRPPSGGPNNQARPPQRPQNTGPNGKRNPQQQSKPIAQRRPGGPQPLPPVVMNQQHKKSSPPAPASAPQKKKPSPFPKKKISYLNSPYAKPPVSGDDDDEGAEDINKVAPLELVGNADAGEAEPSNKRKTTTTTEAPEEVESSTAGKSRDGDESDEYDDDGDYYDDDVNDDEGADDDDNYSDEEEDEEEEEEDEDGDGDSGTTAVEKVEGGGTGTGVSESTSSVKDKKQSNNNSGGGKKNDKRKRKKEKNKKNKNKKRKNKNKNKNKNKQKEEEQESDIETTKQVAKEQFYDDENEKVSEIWTKLNFATTGANYKKPLERLKGTSSLEEEGASEEVGPSEEEDDDDDDDEDDIDEEEEGLKGSLATLQKIRAGSGASGGASVSSGSTEDDADDEVDDENQSKRKKVKTNNKVVKVEGEKGEGKQEVPEKDIAQSTPQKGKGKKAKKNKKNKKKKQGSSEEENNESGADQKRKQHIMMEIGGRPLVPKPDPHSQTNNAHKTTSLMSNRFKFQFINPYMGGIPPPSSSSAGDDEPRPQPMEGGYSAPLRTSYGGNKPESGGAASALSAAASALPFKFKLNAGPLGHFGGTSGASMIPLGGFGHGNSGGMSMEMMPDPHHPPPPTAFGPNGPPNGLRNDAMMGPPQQQHGQQQHGGGGGFGGGGGGAASSLFKYNPIPALTNLFKKQTQNGGGDGHSAPPVNAFIHRPIGPESSSYKRDNRPSPASGSSNAGKKGSKGSKKGNKGKKEKV